MLSDKIKGLRIEKGLSQEELANKLNVVRQTVSKWEKGLSLPDANMLIDLAKVFDTTVSALLDEEPTKRDTNTISESNKLSKTAIVFIILGFPIWFPLLISAAAVVLSVYVSAWAVIISLWSVFGSLVGCAVGGVASGVFLGIGGNFLTGIALLGAGLLSAGVSVFAFFGCKAATMGFFNLTKKIFIWIKERLSKKGEAE